MTPAPLAGVAVVELGQNLAGPVAAQILAHLGADVIGLPLRLDGVRPDVRRAAPRVGAHNKEVLGE